MFVQAQARECLFEKLQLQASECRDQLGDQLSLDLAQEAARLADTYRQLYEKVRPGLHALHILTSSHAPDCQCLVVRSCARLLLFAAKACVLFCPQMQTEGVINYVPYSWVSLVHVKAEFYRGGTIIL